ncbi:MAG: hypothetical protein ACP5GO_02100 [Thermoprotei archaeon]
MIWEGVLEFFLAGFVVGALARRRPALIVSAVIAVFVLSLIVYVASPSLWESAWSGSYERIQGLISYAYSSPFAFSLSSSIGAALAFVSLGGRKREKKKVQAQPMKVKVLPRYTWTSSAACCQGCIEGNRDAQLNTS